MSSTGSISLLLRDLADGEEHALAALHQRCWPQLVALSRRRLSGVRLRSVDEEDVAQEAFWGFVTAVRAGRTPRLDTRHDLFALLTHIVACKAATQLERHLTAKRGSGEVRGESALDAASDAPRRAGLGGFPGRERTPAEEAVLADCYQHYLAALPEALRPIAELHVAGATNAEIADRIGCVERTIERKLALVRSRWQELAERELAD